jgi:hypothetical protein
VIADSGILNRQFPQPGECCGQPFAAAAPGCHRSEGRIPQGQRIDKGTVLRKFALLASACSVVLFAGFASAQQQVDVMVGGATLKSFAPLNDSVNFHPPAEQNGTYVSISGDFVGFRKRRLGLSFETAWRYHQGSYYGYETYRPIFTDANAFFQPKLSKRLGLDLMAGVGVASNRFNLLGSCGIPGCVNYTSSSHFMEDLGFGVRYRVWHRLPHFFVRPEAHYYHIQNNREFNSDNVFRVGASIGYTSVPIE